jgi:Xaa-Pro aminopeptidase
LWQHGKDYAHGTGHGVGSYMNVHEGPQGIHRRAMEPLQPGMIISNEPGYYVEGKYGIRIENLVLVTEAEDIGGNVETHAFENVTWAPIDTRLIDKSLLVDHEVSWLNDYHAQVFEKISPHLDGEELTWLKQATKSL